MVQNLFNPPRKVKMKLVGLDGNAFVIMGACQRNAKRQGWNEMPKFRKKPVED